MNIVVITADDMAPGLISTMPYLDSDPEGNWVRFPNARLNTPQCGPSRVTHFTGRFAHNHGSDTNESTDNAVYAGQDESDYVVTRIRAKGWHTAHVGKYMNGYPWFSLDPGINNYTPPGWADFHASLGSLMYDWRLVSNGVRTFPMPGYETDWSADKVAENITTAAAAGQPFYIHWDAQAPHTTGGTWVPAERHESLEVAAWDRPVSVNEADVSDKPAWVQNTDLIDSTTLDSYEEDRAQSIRMLRALDEGIETVIDALSTASVLGDTVVFFWTDNGWLFGEHRRYGKGVPYDESVKMDLRVRWPGVTSRTDTALVTNADIPATILDLADQTPSVAVDGMSIRNLVTGATTEHRRDLPMSQGNSAGPPVKDWRGVVSSDGWKYIEHITDNEVELYAIDTDPLELENVAASNPAQVAEMARRTAALFS